MGIRWRAVHECEQLLTQAYTMYRFTLPPEANISVSNTGVSEASGF